MANVKIPETDDDLMITYEKTFRTGKYGEKEEKRIITKRGFYSKLFDNFTVPPSYAEFNGVLLPNGFGGDKLNTEQVLNWKYCKH